MTYTMICYNEKDYAIVEAYTGSSDSVPTLKVPMTRKYLAEVDYILGTNNWSDASEDFDFYFERTYDELSEGKAPKLVSWWLATLPNTRTTLHMRRKLWRHALTRIFSRLLSK